MPSSCIMVHMVKGRQYSAYTVQATSMPAPQSQRWSLRPTLDLNTDNFMMVFWDMKIKKSRISDVHVCIQPRVNNKEGKRVSNALYT